MRRREINLVEIEALGPDGTDLGERVLQALRAENGPFSEGRELAIVVRGCLAELRRVGLEDARPIPQAAGW